MKILIILMCFISGSIFSQHGAVPFGSDRGMVIFTKEKEPDTYTGSPYLEKEFKVGAIKDNEGRSMTVLIRYNALEDVVVVKPNSSSNESYMLPKLKSITYELKDYTYFIDNLLTENGWIEGYFAKFYEGDDTSFIGRPEVEVIPPQKAKTGYDRDKPANIKVEMVYYLKVGDENYKEVRLKNKDLEKIFTSERMKKYFKNNKIKSENDVVEMLKFYERNLD